MNYRLLVLLIVIFISTYSLYSAEPLVRFYLQDGSIKSYNLSEIDNIQLPNSPDTLQLQVFSNEGKTFYYPAQLIDSIKAPVDSVNHQRIQLWHDGFKWDFLLHTVDSIILYYTKYVAVTIGTQHWMYRNLDLDHFSNGDSISQYTGDFYWPDLTTPAWCYYHNDSTLSNIYGKIYNWYSLKGLAPYGWHIPSKDEWRTLTSYLGGDTVAGGKMKEKGTTHWYTPNKGATNESGFTALPGGYRDVNSEFREIELYAHWWSSTLDGGPFSFVYRAKLSFEYEYFFFYGNYKESGYYIRCIKD